MMKVLDIAQWNRKEHYNFFSDYDDPFFGIVSEIECTKAYHIAKKEQVPFFAYYLYKSSLAINEIPEFKYRIINHKIVEFDKINAGATIAREDGTFGFSFIEFASDFNKFNLNLQKEIVITQSLNGLRFNKEAERVDTIHYSTLPWSAITSITHPRKFDKLYSVPKIVFGKEYVQGHKMYLPIAINVHHGLIDGIHISQYLEKFQEFMNYGTL
ncbi:CatA-like O-acetyltransferase [Aquimarina rhabdastrellae]